MPLAISNHALAPTRCPGRSLSRVLKPWPPSSKEIGCNLYHSLSRLIHIEVGILHVERGQLEAVRDGIADQRVHNTQC